MRNLKNVFILAAALVVFLAVATCSVTTTVSVAPGESGSGSLILGGDIDADYVSIEVPPLDAPHLALDRGTKATFDDHMTIKTNTAWKLTVEDTSASITNVKGHMEPYLSDGYVDEKNDELTYGFAVLVKGIGGNDGILQDATDLSNGPVDIMQGTSTNSLEKTVYFRYSQEVSGNEIAGDYRIDLTYSLSKNI